ncbi:DJ-1/PfpI family protein [Longirhabdus pacifica]|uniref:DJ-1/PfpI family protein n=1 Tax=Longirhabdus pacifica TaxID=2305227 RepID=UPI0013E8B586|nr:DJ-1/PfpI family protein [Longirhabdus pacifica]
MLVQISLFDGFDLMDAVGPYEIFCAAELISDGAIRAEFVSAEGARTLKSSITNTEISASGILDPSLADIILVPGAAGRTSGHNSIEAILQRAANTDLSSLVKQSLHDPNKTIATVCGGSLLLAMNGLLKGRYAVTNHGGMQALGDLGAYPIDARIVENGNLISSAGVTSGIDLAIYLVEKFVGPKVAHIVEKLMEFERRGSVWKDEGVMPQKEFVQYS